MAIQLMVKAEDPEVEQLLVYLKTQTHLPIHCQIGILERAIKWLQVSDSWFFRCDPNLPNSAHLSIHSPGLPSAPNANTPVQHHA